MMWAPLGPVQLIDRAFAARREHSGDRQRAAYRAHTAVQTQLSDKRVPGHRLCVDDAGADEHTERDGQIERGALLPHVGWREVRRDPARRYGEPRVEQCGADALTALLHRARGQPDGRPLRQSESDVDLDGHIVRVDAEYGGGADRGEHAGGWRRVSRSAHRSHARGIVSPPVERAVGHRRR